MQFPASWFEDEVRDGFYVPAIMKRAWAAELEVLSDVASVCKKYHIRWFMDSGSLIGAVRHHGFIPWDDDLDICMFREDYALFNSVMERELPGYHIYIQNTDSRRCVYTCLANSDSIRWDPQHMEKYHGFPYIAGIDIFPLDYIAPDPEDEELRENLILIVRSAAESINDENQATEEMEARIAHIEELLSVRLDREKPLKEQLFLLLEALFSMYTADEASEAAVLHYWMRSKTSRYPLRCFKELLTFPFEITEASVPAGYDEVLRSYYGDYMKFCRSGGEHDYPYFQDMERRLMGMAGENHPFCRLFFSPKDLRPELVTRGRNGNSHAEKPGKTLRVVFFPFRASAWGVMEPYWRQALADPGCEVSVIPVPYYYKGPDGAPGEMYYEKDLFPKEVPVSDYRTYDMDKNRPDVAFIHNPYDEYNLTASVHPSFYARNLKQYTELLIYIPWFNPILEEFDPEDQKALYNMPYYAAMPGPAYADRTIVRSERMRQAYIDCLTRFAGGATQMIWEEKITCNSRIPFLKMR